METGRAHVNSPRHTPWASLATKPGSPPSRIANPGWTPWIAALGSAFTCTGHEYRLSFNELRERWDGERRGYTWGRWDACASAWAASSSKILVPPPSHPSWSLSVIVACGHSAETLVQAACSPCLRQRKATGASLSPSSWNTPLSWHYQNMMARRQTPSILKAAAAHCRPVEAELQ